MSYQQISLNSKLGRITFFPIGFSWENNEAAAALAYTFDYAGNQDFDDNKKAAKNIVENAIKQLKKCKKTAFVSIFEDQIYVLYSEDLGNPEIFGSSLIPFIERGNDSLVFFDSSFSYLLPLIKKMRIL
jgi:hypothetical protein